MNIPISNKYNNCRILHCTNNINNYNLCVQEEVAGFRTRIAEKGDMVYFAVINDKATICGARGILEELTDYKPWEDADNYVQSWKIKDIEYCNPFELKVLADIGGNSWALKYVQASKTIKDQEAIELLNNVFISNKTNDFKLISLEGDEISEDSYSGDIEEIDDFEGNEDYSIEKLDIMGTFQTIRFRNETDRVRGLEPLVTEHFYSLFQHFNIEKTILIAQNRLFSSVGIKNSNDENINGIKGIPDALLISYDKSSKKSPFKINLIEYECYGETKYRTQQKFNYLNGVIIPQLMRFASTFSIVTDNNIREKTIDRWVDKIIDHINDEPTLIEKVNKWIQELHPNIKERQIERYLEKELRDAFKSNIRIILIIDELTIEQKDTMSNIINSFKLDNSYSSNKDNFVEFASYVVRLEEKIGITDTNARFALAFQE
ncbi:hypothetical protein [Ureibacillus endophyticus]|uniref:Uncharacterized protein n=1 Tax=Ureibacillus endophyticus TaxID=1978490 RepID=A0A494YT86_9BACL|nr:hypothetical protein [Lysinibacillus endophyticus]RKQ13337.1 hypothetical protein D8M03_16285 [Lysinibacillus endophyticus]